MLSSEESRVNGFMLTHGLGQIKTQSYALLHSAEKVIIPFLKHISLLLCEYL